MKSVEWGENIKRISGGLHYALLLLLYCNDCRVSIIAKNIGCRMQHPGRRPSRNDPRSTGMSNRQTN
jgi:hypothetical protein